MTVEPMLNLGVFGAFALLALLTTYRLSNRSSTPDDPAVGGGFTEPQHGVAVTGDFISAASFLGIAGAIAVHGHDGTLYAIGFLVAWIVNLLIIAEPMRKAGFSTVGEVLSFRMRRPPVRVASAVSTMTVSFVYMVAQMAGAGGLVAFLLDVHSGGGQALLIVATGLVMLVCVLAGGIRGTTPVQLVKAGLLLTCAVMITVFLLGKFGFDATTLLREATSNHALGDELLTPGTMYGEGAFASLEFLSLSLALLLGLVGLPHVLTRFRTVPTGKKTRRSVVWAISTLAVFYLCTLVMGYGAVAVTSSNAILAAPGRENSALLLLALHIGGPVLLGIVAAIAFVTILAVIAGLTLVASSSFARDLHPALMRREESGRESEARVARRTALMLGGASIVGGILVNGHNTAFLVGLAFAFAASANAAALAFTLFWRRFNTRGVLWSVYGGLGSCLILVLVSPVVSGTPVSILPQWDFAVFPLSNPGIVSIPFSFLCGLVGTLSSGGQEEVRRSAEMEVRVHTGLG